LYSIDFNTFSLSDFISLLKSIDLLPGRKILLNGIDSIAKNLNKIGVTDLAQLQKLLKKKADYPKLAKELSTTSEYLVILNREINSYESKPLPLVKINLFSKTELSIFEKHNIKTTKDLFNQISIKSDRLSFSKLTKIDFLKLKNALQHVDLLRVNGIGPIYAKALVEIGIFNKDIYYKTSSEEIVKKYNLESGTKPKLGLKDVEYCKRFCKKLNSDTEW